MRIRWLQHLESVSFETLLCVALLSLITSGCTTSSFVDFVSPDVVDPKTDGRYNVTGYMNSRDWTTCFFMVLPCGNLDQTSSSALAAGAGSIESVSLRTENYTINPAAIWAHYGGFLPCIIGTRCNYVDGT